MATYNTTQKHQTAAAKDATPPRKRHNGAALIGLGIAVVLSAVLYGYLMTTNGLAAASTVVLIAVIGVAVGALLLVVGVVLAPRDSWYNSNDFPAAFDEWARTWSCERCGTRFLV